MPQLIGARAYFRGKNKVYEMKNKLNNTTYVFVIQKYGKVWRIIS